MDAADIDINIHPTKTEVKFTDEKYIYAILHSAVKKALSSNSITPSLDFQQESSFDYDADLHKDREIKIPTTKINPDYNPFSNTKRKTASQDSWKKLYDGIEDSKQELTQQQNMEMESTETDEEIKEPTARAILQLHRKYILASVKSGLMIIDQEKAHERILYEGFYQMQENATVHAQQLLFPQTIKLNASKYEMVMNYMEDIQSMGFDISDFGGSSIIVNAAPSDISSAEIIGVFEQIIDNLDYYSAKADLEKNKMLALSMAKSLSIKSGMLLEEQEMNIIIDKLFACKLSDISTEGKKIVEILPLNDINKYFK